MEQVEVWAVEEVAGAREAVAVSNRSMKSNGCMKVLLGSGSGAEYNRDDGRSEPNVRRVPASTGVVRKSAIPAWFAVVYPGKTASASYCATKT